MERITKKIGESIDFVDGKGYGNLSHKDSTRLLFEKLAEYEDIGLTPEEIKYFLKDFGITVTMKNRELKKQHEEDEEIIEKMVIRLKGFEEKYFNMNWIPVTEKLPNEAMYVLVCFEDGFITGVEFDGEDWELWATSGEVVAWRLLPEPYMEE